MASLGGAGGWTAPGDILQGGDSGMKQKSVVFRKNTGNARSEGGTCEETTGKKVITLTLQTAMTKKGRQFFKRKNRSETVRCRPG